MFKVHIRIFSDFLKTYLTFLKGSKRKRLMIEELRCRKDDRGLWVNFKLHNFIPRILTFKIQLKKSFNCITFSFTSDPRIPIRVRINIVL